MYIRKTEEKNLVENWVVSVPQVATSTLRVDEIEALAPLSALSSSLLNINRSAEILVQDEDGKCLVNLSLIIKQEEEDSEVEERLEGFDDYYEQWSLQNSTGNTNRNYSLGFLVTQDSAEALSDDLTRFNMTLPSNAGIKYYNYANPHLYLHKTLFPRRLAFENDFCSSTSSVASSDSISLTNDSKETFFRELGWSCDELGCEVCEEHLLLARTETVTFPLDNCFELLNPGSITEGNTLELKFQCKFCHGRRWIPMAFHNYHLKQAHGIIHDDSNVVLISHPKLLFEHFTPKGYYTACLCAHCEKWIKLSPEKFTKYGGLFEPFFSHVISCSVPSELSLRNSNADTKLVV